MSASKRVYAVGGGSAWDHRRNTSETRISDPDALNKALAACHSLRERDPALVAWIEDGHPLLSEADHLTRFGKPWKK